MMTIEEQQALQNDVEFLREQHKRDAETIRQLTEKVELLMKEIERLSHKKNSTNSSLPPSSDMTRKSQSLRKKSGRSSGGQSGHRGYTLIPDSTVTDVTELKSSYCSACGTSLSNSDFTLKTIRKVIDFTPPPPVHHEYQQYSCSCPHCSHIQTADFPKNVTAPVQYGDNVHALVSYYSVYQYIPYKRLTGMLSDIFQIKMSEGTIFNILNRSADRAQLVYQRIKENICNSSVVGSDETGAKVNTEKWWIWIWQTISDTFIVASDNRGYQTIVDQWENGLKNSVLVSDRWAAQLKTTAYQHQICLAHLLRDIIYVEEIEKTEFISQLKDLVLKVFSYKKEMTKSPPDDSKKTSRFEDSLNKLLALTISEEENPHAHKFQKSLIKVRGYILPCIYDPHIPPDNNGSERGIRNIRVKQKVSGQFKSGQQEFCILRSVIDTLVKREHSLFDMLCQIMTLRSVPNCNTPE
ncbi:MAG: IS66 family transposase [Proteobacteria bacterium]|nr:IS66 family transposase [Pseudomonadota bacterium]